MRVKFEDLKMRDEKLAFVAEGLSVFQAIEHIARDRKLRLEVRGPKELIVQARRRR